MSIIQALLFAGGDPIVQSDPYFNYVQALYGFSGGSGATQPVNYIKDAYDAGVWTRAAGPYRNAGVSSTSPYSSYPYDASTMGQSIFMTSGYMEKNFLSPVDLQNSFCLEGWFYIPSGWYYSLWSDPDIGFIRLGNMWLNLGIATNTWYQNGLAYNISLSSTYSTPSIDSSLMVTGSTWNHIAIIRNGTSNTYLYINGVQAGSCSDFWGSANSIRVYLDEGTDFYRRTLVFTDLRLVSGSTVYGTPSSFPPPSAPLTSIAGTQTLLNGSFNPIHDSRSLSSARAFMPTNNENNTSLGTIGTITAPGYSPPNLSTEQFKFGTSSLVISAGGGFSMTNVAMPKANGDGYTFEGWFYRDANATSGATLADLSNPENWSGEYFAVAVTSTGVVNFTTQQYANGLPVGGTSATTSSASNAFPVNTWVYVAVSRSATTKYLFINGNLVGSNVVNYYGAYSRGAYSIVTRNNAGSLYADELRFTAFPRYTSSFTAPATAFSREPIGGRSGEAVFTGRQFYNLEAVFTDTYSFVVPKGVTSVSAVCVGAGGTNAGGGGGLAYGTIAVTPGEVLLVKTPANYLGGSNVPVTIPALGSTQITRSNGTALLTAYSGTHGFYRSNLQAQGPGGTGGSYALGSVTNGGGGNGGNGGGNRWTYSYYAYGGYYNSTYGYYIASGGGGGGAAGYTGNGGAGGGLSSLGDCGTNGSAGSGGGGGGGSSACGYSEGYSEACESYFSSYEGGGVGGSVMLYGQGTSGAGGVTQFGTNASGGVGSLVTIDDSVSSGRTQIGYGAGGGSVYSLCEYDDSLCQCNYSNTYPSTFSYKTLSAVRIIWGPNRSFPSTNTDFYPPT